MDLIHRCQAGDEEAFAALFHKHKNLVYKTACLMLGSADEAEDVLQEVFLRVHKSLYTFQPSKGAFTTWLHRITVNHCLNRRRQGRDALQPVRGRDAEDRGVARASGSRRSAISVSQSPIRW